MEVTHGFGVAATGAFAFAPPTMSYMPPPVVVDAAVDDGIYALGMIVPALRGPTMQKRITLGGPYARFSMTIVPTGT